MKYKNQIHTPLFVQSGSVLLISLVLLTALSTLGLSSLRNTLTQEKISRNIQDAQLAKDLAQSALIQGERSLIGLNIQGSALVTKSIESFVGPNLSAAGWLSANTLTATEIRLTAEFDAATTQTLPQYFIEYYANVAGPDKGHSASTTEVEGALLGKHLRIISRGTGLQGGNVALFESNVTQQ